MSYSIQLEIRLEKKLVKLGSKDKRIYERVIHKMLELSENPYSGKPLRKVLKGKWRVHVGPFVLIYQINEADKSIVFLEFEHHDEAYK